MATKLSGLAALPGGTLVGGDLLYAVQNAGPTSFRMTAAQLRTALLAGTSGYASGDFVLLTGAIALGTVAVATGKMYVAATEGLVLQGSGSTYDVSLFNNAGSRVLSIQTGTVNLVASGNMLYAGALQLLSGSVAVAQGAGAVSLGAVTRSTIGANGAASALTALPLGYLDIMVAGVTAQIPYYNRGA
jgi:hypothetical protein